MVKSNLHSIFGSLADSTRADILHQLTQGPLSVGDIAKLYPMSLPAVSKHLRILERSGMITRERRGRKQYVQLTPNAINDASDYLEQYKAVLNTRLESFSNYVQGIQPIPTLNKEEKETTNKQQVVTTSCIIPQSPELVWQKYTDPVHMGQWSPPSGTHVVHCENRVVLGGIWKLAVQNSSGAEFCISGTYHDVEYSKKLVFTDGIGEPATPRPEAYVVITFEKLPGNKTLLTRRSTAPTEVHQLNAAWFTAMSS
jgi:uncharacterized protein YndB with AHSA1/START domain/DNA-binding transcriptional ArsR family regulator